MFNFNSRLVGKLRSIVTSQSNQMKGVFAALLGVLLMSLDSVFIKISGVSGFDTAFLFGLFTAISMATFIQIGRKWGLVGAFKISGWPVLLSGLLMLGSATGLIFAVKNTSVANAIVILSSAPMFAAVFSWFILGEVTRRSTLISIVFVMFGISIVVSGSYGSGNILGDVIALGAALCLSLNQVVLRKYKNVDRLASVGMGGLFMAIVMVFLATPSSFTSNTWIIMAAMGLFTAPFGRVLSQTATRYITAPEVGMVLMINTVFASLWAFLFFGEIPVITSLIGGLLILTTIIIYTASTIKISR